MSVILGARSGVHALEGSLSPRILTLLRTVAIGTILLISSRQFLAMGVTLGHLASFALLPLWLPAFRRYAGGRWMLWLGVAATIMSLWLTAAVSVDHDTTTNNLVANTLLLTGSVAAIGVLLWARELLPTWLIGATYGFGMLISAFTRSSVFEDNLWKFTLAVPLAILLLSLALRFRSKLVQVGLLLGLAGASVLFDSRSYFAEFLLAAVLVGWQLIPRRSTARANVVRVVLVFAAVALLVYQLGSALLVEGFLGDEARDRSAEQMDRAGSLILGGRPELAATVALFLHRPMGFGAGALATNADINVAKGGMHAINYDPDNGYVENYMFGSKFELHSMLGDMWAYFGFAGIAFGIAAAVLLLGIIGRSVSIRRSDGVVIFVAVQSLWNFLFNPLYSSAPVLVLALGLGLALRAQRAERGAASGVLAPTGLQRTG